jgi:hypothetical protein
MINARKWQRRAALLVTLGMSTSTVSPFLLATPAFSQSTFSDVQNNWAQSCIQSLAQRNIISGYPDGSFRPDSPVTRAEFAAMVGKAFPNAPRNRTAMQFVDVPSSYWASNAIREASQTGFLSGYPGNVFRPSQNIPRAQVLVSLASGLNYSPNGPVTTTLNTNFDDATAIPDYARNTIAAATENRLVVNYPNVRFLNPNQLASRADVSAFLCQALSGTREASLIPSQYIAGAGNSQTSGLPAGTAIPVRYSAKRIIVAPNETAPLTLTVPQDVTNAQGSVIIPAGSQVAGQLRPANGGSQFVASELTVNGQRYPLNASSEIITQTRNVRDPDFKYILGGAALGAGAAAGISTITGDQNIGATEVLTGAGVGAAAGVSKNRPVTSTLRDAAIGAAVATGISALTGNITAEKSLGGAAAGATIGGIVDRPVERVVVIDPDRDLTLTLAASLNPR